MRKLRVAIPGLILAIAAMPAFTADFEQLGRHYPSCDQYLPPKHKVGDAMVGADSCLMQEGNFNWNGREYVRVDMGLNGTAEGYVTKKGTYHEYLTNGPDLIFNQAMTPGKRYLAVARYNRMRGAAILLVFPKNRSDWNGKLFVTAHGRGRSFKTGELKVWYRYYDQADPVGTLSKYQKVMLAKGYAVAVTRRTSVQNIGEVIATLEDGSIVDWTAFNDNAVIIKEFAAVAKAAVKQRLGSAPSRTYMYGHSAGARIGRSINYTPGLNADADGRRVFDGFLLDDSATGLWLPVVMKDGRDVLFQTKQERDNFAPQVETVHQMYTKVWTRAPNRPDWVSDAYLVNKRNNARILMDKGLGSKFRIYEIRSVSHYGGETPDTARDPRINVLDVSRIMGGAIDQLDALASGRDATPSLSDWGEIGDTNHDGVIEHHAIAFPEVACPLGVYYPYPKTGATTTAFAAFTGQGEEALDNANKFVDMNHDGVWDRRETLNAAWHRLGLLGPREKFTRSKYVACVKKAAGLLHQEGLFTDATMKQYVEQAQQQDLTPAGLKERE